MPKRAVSAAFMFAVCGILAAAPADGPQKGRPRLNQKEVENKWADHWVEIEVIDSGKKVDPFYYFGYSFVPDPEDGGNYADWPLTGELVLSKPPVRLYYDAKPEPMHVDQHGVCCNVPGIFRFEGDDLVWVTLYDGRLAGKLPDKPLQRPKDFTSTKENGHIVRRLKRTDGVYGMKPLDEKR